MKPSRLGRILHEPVPIHRRSAHVIFATVVWPVLTIWGTAYSLMRMPYYAVTLRDGLLAGAVGTLLRAPDLILVGMVFFGFSGVLFSRFGAESQSGRLATVRLLLEPAVTFTAAAVGISLWYPGVVSQPLFLFLDFLPSAILLLLLASLVALGVMVTGRRGRRLKLVGALCVVGLLSPVPLWLRTMLEPMFGKPPTVLLLGIDSISHYDDIAPLSTWVKTGGGTWYEHAVTPGLFTNAVWTSILSLKPVREHGVYHTFQRMQRAEAALLQAARAKGYRTVGSFSDQLTSAPGASAGFDENHSGPIGWRQLLLPMVANSSLLVPVIGSALPRPWPGASPSNESGTFTYDVQREIRSLLRDGGEHTFVAGHLTYVHLPVFPSFAELKLDEFKAVMRSPAGAVRDRTIDWQDIDRPDDPLPLNRWKVRRIQTIIQDEVVDSGFLRQGGQLVLFSDHGSRKLLSPETFGADRYHHVVLATFGLPPQCPQAPISLIDIGRLIGFSDVQAEPAVEFAFESPDKLPAFVRSAQFRWSGAVDLDEGLLAEVFGSLQRHDPWPAARPCTH